MINLKELLQNVCVIGGLFDKNLVVEGLAFNSKEIKNGYAYICLKGSNFDGKDFIADALKAGASVVISEEEPLQECNWVKVDNSRKALSIISQNFYGNPIEKMKLVTVVGTNGKTTTAYLINQILKFNGLKTGFIGTIYNEINGEKFDTTMTTPDPIMLNSLFSEMVKKGVEVVVMELSAHAIYYDKLFGIKADCSIFTNLSQDHLDFFKTYENYCLVKQNYFLNDNAKMNIINVDDVKGKEMADKKLKNIKTYALKNIANSTAMNIKQVSLKQEFVVNIDGEICKLCTSLLGEYNIYNIIASLTVCKELGISLKDAVHSFNFIDSPCGRFNIVKQKGKTIVIDYAHTPDGMKNILIEARKICFGKIIVVFGCGGNRDASKREIMGQMADLYADKIFLTCDNSRYEKTIDIIKNIKEGIIDLSKVVVKENRSEAIFSALDFASYDDLVLILGKGCENYIESNGKVEYFSDFDEVAKWGLKY